MAIVADDDRATTSIANDDIGTMLNSSSIFPGSSKYLEKIQCQASLCIDKLEIKQIQ